MTTDTINIVTDLTGSIIKLGPMVTAPDEAVITDDDLQDFAADSGLNAPFLADLLSMCITHERDGVNLFRMLAATTDNPMLQGKYKKMVGEAEEASRLWAKLIDDLGGNPQYASPPARLTEIMDGKLVESFQGTGSADPLSIEMAGVQATLLAASGCVANATLLQQLAGEADGEPGQKMSEAAEKLVQMADKHHGWAMETMTTMAKTQAKHPMGQKVMQGMEKATAKVKNALQ